MSEGAMFELSLKLYKISEKRYELRFPLYFRILFSLIFTFTVIGMAAAGSFYIIPFIICLISFAAALYNEQWIIDAETAFIEYRFGLLFFSKKTRIPFEEIAALKLSSFTRGAPTGSRMEKKSFFQKNYISLQLIKKDDTLVTMETHKETRKGDFKQSAEEIARLCGCPLREE
jgi:hypothetical protein